jgi:hypothetical protein
MAMAIPMVANAVTPSLLSCRTMALGSKGDCVRSLQESIVATGVRIRIDGGFGPQTEAAVRAFQSWRGLTPDGIAGPATLKQLDIAANSPKAVAPPNQTYVQGPPPKGTVVDGAVWDCGNTFGTCSFYFSRPVTRDIDQAFQGFRKDVATGGSGIAVCHRISEGKSGRVKLACDVMMLLGTAVVKDVAHAAATGNGCLRVRWLQDPMVPVKAYNDGGRNCIGV